MAFELRPFQREALAALERPGHVICVAPTGSGKSLIYERIAAQAGVRMLIVSPLIALARQQASRLRELQFPVTLAAGPEPEPPPERSGTWIISPERLAAPSATKYLDRWRPDFLVVDECHCLWDWGERFRPSFLALPGILLKQAIGRSLWLTATLPASARAELRAALPQPIVEIGSFALPAPLRLSIERIDWSDRADKLLEWIRLRDGAGIVFAQTRSGSERLRKLIAASGKTCAIYHAGLASEERRNAERTIERKIPDVIVATSAFGMGMNHPHLTWALLWQAPPSVLSLAQAIGRVGRDQRIQSNAKIFWDEEDFQLLEWMIRGSERMRREIAHVREFLASEVCRSQALQEYFNSVVNTSGSCEKCDYCERINFTGLKDPSENFPGWIARGIKHASLGKNDNIEVS